MKTVVRGLPYALILVFALANVDGQRRAGIYGFIGKVVFEPMTKIGAHQIWEHSHLSTSTGSGGRTPKTGGTCISHYPPQTGVPISVGLR